MLAYIRQQQVWDYIAKVSIGNFMMCRVDISIATGTFANKNSEQTACLYAGCRRSSRFYELVLRWSGGRGVPCSPLYFFESILKHRITNAG